MINIQDYYGKLARSEPVSDDEVVDLLRELTAFRAGAAFLASCQGATLEGLPKSTSKSQRARHITICTTAAQIMRGDLSGIRYATSLEDAEARCRKAAEDAPRPAAQATQT